MTSDAAAPDTDAGSPKPMAQGPRVPTGALLAGRYAVEAFLGLTVIGEVYRATDRTDGKSVWIKLLPTEMHESPQTLSRLEDDAAFAVMLDHKNIAFSYGLFIEAGNVFLVSEPIDGTSLRQMLEKKQRSGRAFSVKGAFNVVTHLCNALEYTHQTLLHGLISSDTVLVNTAGRVKIGDFGLGRGLPELPAFRGRLQPASLACIAPELIDNPELADGRADVYAIGALLFELLTGQPADNANAKASALVAAVPAALDAVIQRCLQHDAADRYPDTQELRLAILAAAEPTLSPVPAPTSEPAKSTTPAGGRPMPPVPGGPPTRTSGQHAVASPPPRPASTSVPPSSNSRPRLPGLGASSVDENQERWLIQKDKLDFGPFKLTEVKTQITSGQIRGEHTIVDTENGEKHLVAQHPLLRELAESAQLRIDADKEAEAANVAAKSRGRRTLIIVGIVGVTAVAAAVIAAVIVLGKEPQVVYRDRIRDRSADDDLRGIEITMKVDPPAKTEKHHHSHTKNANGEWNDSTNLGDATEGGGDETLGQEVVQKVMMANFGVLKGCVLEERSRNKSLKTVDMDFIIKGTGMVQAVKVNGEKDSPFASCMYGKMQSVAFPKFNGASTHASFSLALK